MATKPTSNIALAAAAAVASAGVATLSKFAQAASVKPEGVDPKVLDAELSDDDVTFTLRVKFNMNSDPEKAIMQTSINCLVAKDSDDEQNLAILCSKLGAMHGKGVTARGNDGMSWLTGDGLPPLGSVERDALNKAYDTHGGELVADVTFVLTGDIQLKNNTRDYAEDLQLYSPKVRIESIGNIEKYSFIKHRGFPRATQREGRPQQGFGQAAVGAPMGAARTRASV